MATNTLRVVQGHDHPWLLSHRLSAMDLSWVAGASAGAGRAGVEGALPPGRRGLHAGAGERRAGDLAVVS